MAIRLNLLLDKQLWIPEVVDALQSKGHTVHYIDTYQPGATPVDAIVGYTCWRIPPMVSVTEVRKHLDTIIKQIRATKHDVHSTATPATPKRAAAKPRKAPGGKRKPEEASTPAATPASAEGQPGATSINA